MGVSIIDEDNVLVPFSCCKTVRCHTLLCIKRLQSKISGFQRYFPSQVSMNGVHAVKWCKWYWKKRLF